MKLNYKSAMEIFNEPDSYCMERLDLSNCLLNTHQLRKIFNNISKGNHLELASLNVSGNIINKKAACHLAQALCNSHITDLNLSGCMINVEVLGILLPSIKDKVTHLNLSDNFIVNDDLNCLAGCHFIYLNLSHNNLQDEHIKYLANTHVVELDLSHNCIGPGIRINSSNDKDYDGINSLVGDTSIAKDLKKLDLSRNPIGPGGVLRLLQGQATITCLKLVDSLLIMTDPVAKAITYNRTITDLDLSGCFIPGEPANITASSTIRNLCFSSFGNLAMDQKIDNDVSLYYGTDYGTDYGTVKDLSDFCDIASARDAQKTKAEDLLIQQNTTKYKELCWIKKTFYKIPFPEENILEMRSRFTGKPTKEIIPEFQKNFPRFAQTMQCYLTLFLGCGRERPFLTLYDKRTQMPNDINKLILSFLVGGSGGNNQHLPPCSGYLDSLPTRYPKKKIS